jgi:hypothetical protein
VADRPDEGAFKDGSARKKPPHPGLMQWPEFRRIGFAGKMKICCAPPYQS